MKFQLSLDRFEGDKKQIAVLLTEDGTQISFPRGLLPRGSKAGDIFSLTIEKDVVVTRIEPRDKRFAALPLGDDPRFNHALGDHFKEPGV